MHGVFYVDLQGTVSCLSVLLKCIISA